MAAILILALPLLLNSGPADAGRTVFHSQAPAAAQRHEERAASRDLARTRAEREPLVAAASAEAPPPVAMAQQVSQPPPKAPAAATNKKSPKPSRKAAPAGPPVAVPASCKAYSGNRAIGCSILLQYGFGLNQMPCLDKLWNRESGWNAKARNPSSGAYGIPQSLPGRKMASAGNDWQINPATQIKWGLGYIKGRYRTPCAAWGHSQSTGWY